jgi:hypothetical protein
MLDSSLLKVEVDEASEGDEVILRIATPVGTVEIMGTVSRMDRVLYVERAHIQGLYPGALGRAGLNAVARKLLDEADVEEIVVEGSARTTGRNPRRRPKIFRFPHG